MSKILIWRQIIPGSDIDVFNKTDYTILDNRLFELYGGKCPNWGNKLWFQGILSEINTPENKVVIRTDESIEEINTSYDLIVYPMANFFSVEYASDTSGLVEVFRKITIPVYIIACGAQADNYGDIEKLIQRIGDSSSRFIETIYNTGGEFALRGQFTKEFFNRLGFKSAVVTGCPSLFQLGPSFRISTEKVPHKELVPITNGNLALSEKIMKKIPDSVYLSQELYEDCLYRESYFTKPSLKKDIYFSYNYSVFQAELLGQGRIKMIVDTNDWYHYIKDNNYNFSIGTKLHGSVMSLLAGIPAVLIAIDSRTREVAEFFDIPFVDEPKKPLSITDFYRIYDEMDYSAFNSGFEA